MPGVPPPIAYCKPFFFYRTTGLGPSGSTESWAKSYCCRLARKSRMVACRSRLPVTNLTNNPLRQSVRATKHYRSTVLSSRAIQRIIRSTGALSCNSRRLEFTKLRSEVLASHELTVNKQVEGRFLQNGLGNRRLCVTNLKAEKTPRQSYIGSTIPTRWFRY